jgi:hypothetical protein
MLDFAEGQIRVVTVAREDKAMQQRCKLSARSVLGDGQEYMSCHMLFRSRSSSGSKAINLLALGYAQSRALQRDNCLPVGHMSMLSIRRK